MPQLPPLPRQTTVVQRDGVQTPKFADWMLLLWTALNRLIAGIFDGPITTPGVQFPDPQVPSTDPHTLDDYEEGAWTPTIGGTGGQSGQTYAQQNGFYVKIGRIVHAACRVQLTALGTITGAVQIKGLPFAALSNTGYRATGTVLWSLTTTAYINISAVVNQNASVIDLVATAAATTDITTQPLAQANLANLTRFVVSIVYEADA